MHRILVEEKRWVSDPEPRDLVLALGAALATLRFHVGMLRLIAACAALGVLWRLLFAAPFS